VLLHEGKHRDKRWLIHDDNEGIHVLGLSLWGLLTSVVCSPLSEGFSCGFGGVFSIRFSVSVNFFSGVSLSVSDKGKLQRLRERWQSYRYNRRIEIAVGRIATEWSRLEYATNQLLVEMMALPNSTLARVVGNEMGHRNKLSAIRAMAIKMMEPKDARFVVDLVNFIDNELRPCRNDYVHGIFKGLPDTRALYHKTRITKPKPYELHVDVERELIGIIEVADMPRAAIRDAMRATLFLAMHFNPDEGEATPGWTWLDGAKDALRYSREAMDEYKRAQISDDE
jgi:hypothetical protein